MLILGFAFLAGVLTILAPCTLPMVPLIVGGSVGGGRRRLAGIVLGFGATFVALTVLLAAALAAAGITTDLLRVTAAVVFGIAGLSLTWNRLGRWFERGLAPLQRGSFGTAAAGGLTGGLAIGAGLGLLWAPCVGPIMAAVIATATVAGPSPLALGIAVAYVAGAAIPLLAVARLGRRATAGVVPSAVRVRRGIGVAMVVTSALVLTRLDVSLQARLVAELPGLSQTLLAVEENPIVDDGLTGLRPSAGPRAATVALDDLGPAPELTGISAWINSEPTTLAALRGKVVLVHFWTFGCINCQHVQPYVKAWYERYADAGLVVLGIHTPELSYERDLDNVRQAVADKGVTFPVAVDPEFATWNAYGNRYWPAFYFVDRAGEIRHVHFGEGDYDGSEAVIAALLAEPA